MTPVQVLLSEELVVMQGDEKIELWDSMGVVREQWDDCAEDSAIRFFPQRNLLVYYGAMDNEEYCGTNDGKGAGLQQELTQLCLFLCRWGQRDCSL